MQLPTDKDLRQNYQQWKEYSQELANKIDTYENSNLLTAKFGESWGKRIFPKLWPKVSVFLSNYKGRFHDEFWRSCMEFCITIGNGEYFFTITHDGEESCELTIDKNFLDKNKRTRNKLLNHVIIALEKECKVNCNYWRGCCIRDMKGFKRTYKNVYTS